MASSVLKAMAEKAGPAVHKQTLMLTDAAASRVSLIFGLVSSRVAAMGCPTH
uniref:Uncharacterized protein n=1 Tax=Arundo donax TaxID=35708 RepID=A0A0A9FKB7_ARUDO